MLFSIPNLLHLYRVVRPTVQSQEIPGESQHTFAHRADDLLQIAAVSTWHCLQALGYQL